MLNEVYSLRKLPFFRLGGARSCREGEVLISSSKVHIFVVENE